MPEEKRLYAEKRNQATKGNNQGKVEHTDWNAAHKDIKPETRQQRGRAGQCTRCGMTNHTWKQCRRNAVISIVGQRKPFQAQKRGFSGFRSNQTSSISNTKDTKPSPSTEESDSQTQIRGNRHGRVINSTSRYHWRRQVGIQV